MNEECRKYLKQARINEELALFLRENCKEEFFLNWIFVLIFYSALHYFNAFLASKGEKIPEMHKSKNYYNLGGIDLAKKCFMTGKNGISDSVGEDYEHLFNWSHDVRYKPARAHLLGKADREVAFEYLEAIKLVVANEIGYIPKFNKSKRKVYTEKAKEEYLKKLYKNRQKNLNSQ